MVFSRKKTPEELAAEAEQRAEAEARYQAVVARAKANRQRSAQEQATKDEEAQLAEQLRSPAAQARTAFERNDALLQCSIEFGLGGTLVIAVVGHGVTQQPATPAEVLNSIDREGWELVTGSFLPGAGTVFGHYLFKRCAEHRATVGSEGRGPALT